MATTYKVLGQLEPQSTSGTLYTVPAATSTIVSTINAVNKGASAGTISIAIRPGGATLSDEHYIVYELSLSAKTTFTYTGGITLAATDVVTVVSSNNDISFNAFGSEIA